ncbi:hypothetical protein KX729_13520 [Rhizobium sp. XQZ8]|uniref:hypothetical protein n=1 Tax=Rhizobium populisoli TaxID=2859785 RepID=UPI001CA5A740|nr:hypothetical protein [Rhizobium populisoli]MBW6422471.1 hypothetical protein [Rhizobium populisoli]
MSWGRTSFPTLLMVMTLAFHAPASAASDARFGSPIPALKRLIASTEPRPKGMQHFCVVTYRASGGYAWVHWREANKLIFWGGTVPDTSPDDTLVFAPRKLDLKTDVVRSRNEVGSSTYLVTRKWVAARLTDCKRRGAHYKLADSDLDR